MKNSIGLLGNVTVLLLAMAPPAGIIFSPAEGAAQEDDIQSLWKDLEKSEPDSTAAILKLAGRPEETVAFLKDELAPLILEKELFESLLTDLGSEDEEIWKKAFESFGYFDPRLYDDLESLMDRVDEAPTRQRLVEVLSGRPAGSLKKKDVKIRKVGDDGYNFSSNGSSWWAEHKISRLNGLFGNRKTQWTRAVRAIVLLEHIGTRDALEVLTPLTTGHPEAQPTIAARKSAIRMKTKLKKAESKTAESK